MNKKLDKSKQERTTTTKRDNHNKVGNNNGNNSDSKYCCLNVIDLRSYFILFRNNSFKLSKIGNDYSYLSQIKQ